jgi:Ser/Thr protein kinase RdoA (MazF antagonist)
MSIDTAQIKRVCEAFRLEGEFAGCEENTVGNINKTYKVTYRRADGTVRFYVLQKINMYVFREPEKIMSNIDLVTTHIREKCAGRPALHFHHTEKGDNYYNADGCFWRLSNYIDSVTYDISDDPEMLRRTGHAFGEFQMLLSDFDASLLHETIPDFHNTKKRLDRLFADAETDPLGRAAYVRPELEYIQSRRVPASMLTDIAMRGDVPLRVTHNDTKSNNILFDRVTREPIAVIDLDTVMPGLAVHDFGDAVRSAANTAAEDEEDLTKVSLDLELYRAFTEGFISQTADALTSREINTMALGALTITIELASRFLDDYLTGDKYFKVEREGQNVARTRCQLQLARDMEDKFSEMNVIVREAAGARVNN